MTMRAQVLQYALVVLSWPNLRFCIVQDIDDGDTSQMHHRFVSKALQPLVALLLEQLIKQDVRLCCLRRAERSSLFIGSTPYKLHPTASWESDGSQRGRSSHLPRLHMRHVVNANDSSQVFRITVCTLDND